MLLKVKTANLITIPQQMIMKPAGFHTDNTYGGAYTKHRSLTVMRTFL